MEKKEYIEPKVEVIELESQVTLLNNTELSIAPTPCNLKELA